MSAGFIVAPLRATDVEAAVALWDAAGLLRPWNDPRADFRRAVGQPCSDVLGGRSDGALVATAMVGHDGHRGWLYYLAVAAQWRGRGFGTAMMRACENWCRAHDIPKLQLLVRNDNLAALSFYERLAYARGDVVVLGRRLDDQP